MEGKRKAIDDDGGGNNGGNIRDNIDPFPQRRRKRAYPPPFLMKTFDLVDDPETDSIISWTPNKKSFTVWNQIRFTSELLPKHFRHGNFSSFVYQLNNYGFKKISWERFEYENEWFQAGHKHLLKNIKRRNQEYEHDAMIHPSGGSADDVLKDKMEDQLETLTTEQHVLKVQLEKLNDKQKKMMNHFKKLEEIIKVSDGEKDDMVSQLLVQVFIQKLREKREERRNEAAESEQVIVAEGDCSRYADKNEQVQEEVMEIQLEGQAFSSPDDSGGSNQERKAAAASEPFVNRDYWKTMMEDDSLEHGNGGYEELEEYHPKAIMKLQDLIASNTLGEEENKVETLITVGEEQDQDSETIT